MKDKKIQSMIKKFQDFINESSSWVPNFKSQGETINKKDHVTIEELEKLAWYFENFFKMEGVKFGKIKATPDSSSYTRGETVEKYGVIGKNEKGEEFCYYWKQSTDPELEEIESGWVGKAYLKGKSPGQFMSPYEFLQCVTDHYFQENSFVKNLFSYNPDTIKNVMDKLALQSPRRGKIMGKKYGI